MFEGKQDEKGTRKMMIITVRDGMGLKINGG